MYGVAFSGAYPAVRAVDADEHQGLAVHRRHRQAMRADGGQVEQHGLDALDGCGGVHGGGGSRINHKVIYRPSASPSPTPISTSAKIGSASCRKRGGTYCENPEVAV